jgi:hypothetical protein
LKSVHPSWNPPLNEEEHPLGPEAEASLQALVNECANGTTTARDQFRRLFPDRGKVEFDWTREQLQRRKARPDKEPIENETGFAYRLLQEQALPGTVKSAQSEAERIEAAWQAHRLPPGEKV